MTEDDSVWEEMTEESEETHESLPSVYMKKVLFFHKLKRNPTHKSIMSTLKRARDEEEMDFDEALNYATEKRKFLILRKRIVNTSEAEEDN